MDSESGVNAGRRVTIVAWVGVAALVLAVWCGWYEWHTVSLLAKYTMETAARALGVAGGCCVVVAALHRFGVQLSLRSTRRRWVSVGVGVVLVGAVFVTSGWWTLVPPPDISEADEQVWNPPRWAQYLSLLTSALATAIESVGAMLIVVPLVTSLRVEDGPLSAPPEDDEDDEVIDDWDEENSAEG